MAGTHIVKQAPAASLGECDQEGGIRSGARIQTKAQTNHCTPRSSQPDLLILITFSKGGLFLLVRVNTQSHRDFLLPSPTAGAIDLKEPALAFQ